MLLKRIAGFGAPAVVNVVVRLVSVPITTYYLGPIEFGEYAIVLGVAAVFQAVTSSFSSYVISHRYLAADDPESSRAIHTCIVVEFLLALACAAIMFLVWPLLAQVSGLERPLPEGSIVLTALSIPLATLWQSVTTVVIYEGRARSFAMSYTMSAVIQTATAAGMLYLGFGLLGLFVGYVCGTAVTAAYAMPTVLHHWKSGLSAAVLRDMRGMAWLAMPSNLSEAAMAWFERAALSRFGSLHLLGLYYHSQNYRHLLLSVVKAIGLAGYRKTIEEARTERGRFEWTVHAWTIMFGMLAVSGVGAALVGRDVVAFLTHDKFTEAAPLIPLWCLILVLQQMARPQQFRLMAAGEANRLSSYKLVSIMIATVSLLVTVPLLGIYGPIASVLVKEVIHRGLVYARAARAWGIQFADHNGVAAASIILAGIGISVVLPAGWWLRLAATIAIGFVIGIRALRSTSSCPM